MTEHLIEQLGVCQVRNLPCTFIIVPSKSGQFDMFFGQVSQMEDSLDSIEASEDLGLQRS